MTFAVIEIIYRGGIAPFLSWIKYYPLNSTYLLLFLFLLFSSFMLLNYKGYFIVSLLSSILFSVLAFASHTKEVLRGDPLLPTDLILVNEATNIINYFTDLSLSKLLFIVFSIIVFIVISLYAAIKIKNAQWRKQDRIFPLLFLVTFIGFLYQDMFIEKGVIKNLFDIEVPVYNQSSNYNSNGVVLSFIRNINNRVEKPKDYSHSKVSEIINDTETNIVNENKSETKPNIIFIQSEAFWDPTVMESVKYNEVPIPNFHSLASQFTSKTLNSKS